MGGGQSTTRLVERAATMAPSTSSQEAVAKAISFDGITDSTAKDVLGTSSQSRVFRQAKELHEEKLAEGMSGEDIFTELDAAFGAQMAAQRCATRARFTCALRGAQPVVGAGKAGPGMMDSAGLAVGLTFARAGPAGSRSGAQRRLNMVVKKRAAAQIEEMRPKVALRESAKSTGELKQQDVPKLLEILRNFLFKGVHTSDIEERVVQHFSEHVYFESDRIIQQGDSTNHFFHVVAEGECEVLVDDKPVAKVGPGKCLGELSLIFETAPNATIRAISPTVKTWSLEGSMFREVLQRSVLDSSLQRAEWLGKLPAMAALSPFQISELASRFKLISFEPGTRVPPGIVSGDIIAVSRGGLVAQSVNGSQTRSLKEGDIFAQGSMWTALSAGEAGEFKTTDLSAGPDGAHVLHLPLSIFEVVSRQSWGDIRDRSAIVGGLRLHKDFAHLNRVQLQGLAKRAKIVQLGQSEVYMNNKTSTVLVLGGTVTSSQEAENSAADAVSSAASLEKCTTARRASFVAVENLFKGGLDGESAAGATHRVQADAELGARIAVLDKWMVRQTLDGLDIDEQGVMARADTSQFKKLSENMALSNLTEVAKLGEGTFGRVSLVKHGDKLYALKCMSKAHIVENEQEQHVVDEKRTLLVMRHAFVVELFATFSTDKALYLVLEYCPGGELWSVIHEQHSYERPMPVGSVQFYSACITSALKHMHLKGMIYRDLKPENVLISALGYAKITDMGLAKAIPYMLPSEVQGEAPKIQHKTFTVCGTPEYISPEIIYNVGHDGTADYWALGVLTFELLSGITPFSTADGDLVQLFKNICVTKSQAFWPERDRMAQLPWPEEAVTLTQALKSFVTGLLNGDTACRLGAGGVEEMLSHVFFEGFDWGALEAQTMPAPWKPELATDVDTTAFTNVPDEPGSWDLADAEPVTDCEYFEGW